MTIVEKEGQLLVQSEEEETKLDEENECGLSSAIRSYIEQWGGTILSRQY